MSANVPHLDTIGVGRGCSLGRQKDTNGPITLPAWGADGSINRDASSATDWFLR